MAVAAVARNARGPPKDRSQRTVLRPTARRPSRAASGHRSSGCPSAPCPSSRRRCGGGTVASVSRAPTPRHAARSDGPAVEATVSTRRPPDRARSASTPRRSGSPGPSRRRRRTVSRPAHPVGRPCAERFCCLRLAVQPSCASAGQIRSSSVWLSLGDRSVGKRIETGSRNAVSRSASPSRRSRSRQSRKLGDRFSKEVLGEQAPLEGPDHRHPRPPKLNSRESAWSSSAILSIVESSYDSDPARASKLAPATLERASSYGLRGFGLRTRPSGCDSGSAGGSELTPPRHGRSPAAMGRSRG